MIRPILAALLLFLSLPADAAPLADRLVWLFGFDLADDRDFAAMEQVLDDGAQAGINGAVLSIELHAISRGDAGALARLKRLEAACAARKIELIPAMFSFGYGGPFLSVDRNLAEGLPVKGARFTASANGTAVFQPDPGVGLKNGGFEELTGHTFAGMGFVDDPGKISFADTTIKHSGTASIRLTNFMTDPHGHGRVHQKVALRPHRCYRVTIHAKAQGLTRPGYFNLATLSPEEGRERSLAQRTFKLGPDADWTKFTYLFNSGKHDAVLLYAGVWEGKSGTLWLDDWGIEEAGPINVLRRPGTPVAVANDDGIRYEEGRDYARLEDPDLHPWTQDKPAPELKLPPGSRIRPGETLRVSWYHSQVVHEDQVGVCMAEPKIYEIVEAESKALFAHLKPKRILLNMDEIRFGGTCRACEGQNMAKLLGGSITKIRKILKQHHPKLEILIWSDMFDPNHNAHGDYYYVNGDYTGSWNHIPKDLTMAIWGSDVNPKSFAHFSKLGFKTLGACYYDADDLDAVKPWIEVANKTKGGRGVMYTTWERKYALLKDFGALAGRP